MNSPQPRQRAPSKRSLATRERVLDAAEKVFADKGFDGATIRDIGLEAGEPIGSVHHHGGGKEALFHQTVARRAEALSRARLESLAARKAAGETSLESVLAAFVRPIFELSRTEPRWRDYARLVAYVSADERWAAISAECFDPTAAVFLADIAARVPGLSPEEAAEGFVYTVSAMLALLTSQQRVAALGGAARAEEAQLARLIRFCAAGIAAR